MLEKPLITDKIRNDYLQRCQVLLSNIESASAGRSVIEKTWTVDPVMNRRNDRFVTFGDQEENIITTTKYPASVGSFFLVVSNGKTMLLTWFPVGYRLNKGDYVNILARKFLPRVKNNFLTAMWCGNRMALVSTHQPNSELPP